MADNEESSKVSGDGSSDARSRRKVVNLIQRPKQQIKYIMYFLASGMILLLIVFSFILFTLSNLVNTMTQLCGMGEDVQAAIQQSIMSAWIVFAIVFTAFAAMSIATGLLISHRIFGAMVPIRRQLEAMLAGDYGRRGHLREHDELQEIMSDLNALSEKLESRHGKST